MMPPPPLARPSLPTVIEPESDRGKGRAGSDYGTRERDRILAQKIDWLGPISDTFLQIHRKQLPSFLRCSFTLVLR